MSMNRIKGSRVFIFAICAIAIWNRYETNVNADPCIIILPNVSCSSWMFLSCSGDYCTNIGAECSSNEDVLTGSTYEDYRVSTILTNGTDDIYFSDESEVTCVETFSCDCLANEVYDEELEEYVAYDGTCHPSSLVNAVTFYDIYESGSPCPEY